MKNYKKTCLLTVLILAALAITLLKYETWSYAKSAEDHFHSATLTLVIGANRHEFVYGDPLAFFEDLSRAQMAREKGTTLLIGESRFAGAGIARIRGEINAHSQNVRVELERESLAQMQICHCSQRSELTYLDRMAKAVARLHKDINHLLEITQQGQENSPKVASKPDE